MSELGIKERHSGSITILDTVGRLRIGLRFGRSSVTLAEATAALIASGTEKILLNLNGLNVLSAKELGDLVWSHLEITKHGGQFKLFNLTPNTRELMLSTKLSTVLDFYESEKQAIDSFDKKVTLEVELNAIL